jgi:hypothetical protein
MHVEASEEPRASSRHRIMRDRAGCNRRDLDGRRRDAREPVAHAHSAVSARPHREDSDTHRVGTVLTIENINRTIDDAIADRTIGVAGALYHAETESVHTASRLADPKRRRAHLAAATAACRLCLLDWSDHGQPFR